MPFILALFFDTGEKLVNMLENSAFPKVVLLSEPATMAICKFNVFCTHPFNSSNKYFAVSAKAVNTITFLLCWLSGCFNLFSINCLKSDNFASLVASTSFARRYKSYKASLSFFRSFSQSSRFKSFSLNFNFYPLPNRLNHPHFHQFHLHQVHIHLPNILPQWKPFVAENL